MTYYRDDGGAAALNFMRKLTGLYYLLGGTPPGRTDCSGLVEWGYAQVGVKLYRTTYQQYGEDPFNNRAVPSQPGDLHFIPGSDPIGILPGHVEVYVSPGQVFQAEETGVRIGQFARDTDNWEYRTRPSLALGFRPIKPIAKPLPIPQGTPTAGDLKVADLVPMKNVTEANLAKSNGWALYYFSEHHSPPFVPQVGGEPTGCTLYANASYRTKR